MICTKFRKDSKIFAADMHEMTLKKGKKKLWRGIGDKNCDGVIKWG